MCIFAGTTEDRELVELLAGEPVAVTACVATEYGETLLTHRENLTISFLRTIFVKYLTSAVGGAMIAHRKTPYASSVPAGVRPAGENREPGENPGRYRRCICRGPYSLTKVSHWETGKAESDPQGGDVPPTRMSQKTCLRRAPAYDL